jgi:hypothetical protein
MADVEILCPNCKAALPAELKRVLLTGTTVTCENCGIVLVPKLQGEPSKAPTEKTPEPTSVRQAIKQALRETKASIAADLQRTKANLAADMQRTKANIAAELHRNLAPVTSRPEPPAQPAQPERPAPPAAPASPEPLASPASPGTSGPPPQHPKCEKPAGSKPCKQPKRGTPKYTAALKVKIEKAKKGLRSYNEVSLVLMRILLAVFYIASIFNLLSDAFTGKPYFANLVVQAPLYIIGAFLYWYETHRIHEWVKQGVYEFYGVDMIIVGIFGCMVCGIGVLMLIKGFVVMGIMVAQDKVAPKARRDVLISWINGFDEVSWYIAALVAAAAFIFAASFVISGIISLSAPSPQFIACIIMGIFGIVAANSDLHDVSKHCREYRFENLGGKSLVYGILGCICFGAGTPMIVKAILLFVLDGVDKKQPPVQKPIEQPLPRHDASLPAPLKQAEPTATEKPAGPSVPVQPVQPAAAPVQKLAPAQAPAPARAPAPAQSPVPARKKAPSLPPKASTSVEVFLQRNFNVLTPRVRKRLLRLRKLGVTDDDIEAIAEELVHHPEFQQLDIIDEYIQLNKADEVDPMHVLSVRSMSYDENTKKWMLDQLRSIPDKDVPAFIDEMKRNQPTP